MINNGFIITSDQSLQPCYRISPFTTSDLKRNAEKDSFNDIDVFFEKKFNDKKYVFTSSAREGISVALKHYDLNSEDVVSILTTTSNHYISGCVTNVIEKYCKWSRVVEKNTKLIFVNHEFGFPFENLIDLKKYNLPIIEDCAHSFMSQNLEHSVGFVGDFVIYSLPKIFPMQCGGILKSNIDFEMEQCIPEEEEIYIKKVLSLHINNLDEIKRKRISNYRYLEKGLGELGFKSRFRLMEYQCPGVYLFEAKNMDLNGMKSFMQEHGVECSVFYGEEGFFIPVNQSIDEYGLDYFITLIDHFRSRGSSND